MNFVSQLTQSIKQALDLILKAFAFTVSIAVVNIVPSGTTVTSILFFDATSDNAYVCEINIAVSVIITVDVVDIYPLNI
jgi:hypothetical protein